MRMTFDQLLELNDVICQRIDELKEQETLQALSQLRVGLKVTFSTREGPAFGIVTKINRKSVIMLAETAPNSTRSRRNYRHRFMR